MTAFERYGVKKAKKPIYAAYSFRERLNRAQFVVLNGIINICIHAVHAGRVGVMLNNETLPQLKKERDLYGYMTFMDSEVHCWCAACPVLERAPLMAVMDDLRSATTRVYLV